MKQKLWGALFTVLAPLAIAIVGGYLQNQLVMARMEERIATIKEQAARHELEKGREIARISTTTEDHSQRIIRLETNLDAIQSTLGEVRADIKTLLRGVRE